MATITSAPGNRRRVAHTDVYSPIEVVISRIVYFVFGVIVSLLAIRFVFSLFAANTAAPFVRFIYGVTDVFMIPFNAIFANQRVNASTFEWSVLIAIVIYALIAWAIVAFIHAVSPRSHSGTVETVEHVDRDDVVYRDDAPIDDRGYRDDRVRHDDEVHRH